MALIKCPECGKMVSDSAEKCIGCGFPLSPKEVVGMMNQDVEQQLQQRTKKPRKEKNSKNRKKVLITLAIVLPLLIVAGGLVFFFNSDMFKYMKAQKAQKNEDYEKAIELYGEIGDYKDSKEQFAESKNAKAYNDAVALKNEEKYDEAVVAFEAIKRYRDSAGQINDCYYKKANAMAEAGKTDAALETYNLILDYEDVKDRVFKIGESYITSREYSKASEAFDYVNEAYPGYKDYASAMSSYEAGKYDAAIKGFKASKGIYDSDEKLKDATYKKAKKDYDSGNYASAKSTFKEIKGYKDSDELYTNCDFMAAKSDFDKGNLNAAKKAFSSLPEDLTVNGKSVADYLVQLEQNSSWVDICGKWVCKSGTAITKETHRSTGSWDSWEYDMSYSSMASLEVRCVLKDDSTVDVSITGDFFKLTNYSILSAQVHQTTHAVYVNKNVSSMGSIESDSCTTITLGTDAIKIDYKKVDDTSNAYFTDTYTTNCTLKRSLSY